jgi:PAS domain S-box-containing protein
MYQEMRKRVQENADVEKIHAPAWKHVKKNGEEIWINVHGNLITYNNRKARLLILHDVTGTVRTEKELEKSNERFRLAAKAASEALWEWDIEKDEVFISPVYKEMFGFDIDPRRKYEEWHDYIHPDDKKSVTESFYATIEKTDNDHWSCDYRYLRADGSYAFVSDNCLILRNEKGKAIKVVGAMQDNTHKKIAEQELVRSNERFKLATRATSDAIYDWDMLHEALHWGEGLQTLFGHQEQDVTMDNWEDLIHPDDRKQVIAGLKQAVYRSKKNFWKSEYRFQKADGSYAYVLDRGFIERDEKGKPLRMIGAVQDTTNQKLKEQQLLESKERFDSVMKATHDLIWDWNLDTGYFYRDKDGLRKVYGVDKAEDIQTVYAWMQRIHPDDLDKVHYVIDDILHAKEQNTFDLEYRFRRDDGVYSHVYDRGILIRNAEGRPVRMMGAAQDITERKKLEQQLLQRELEKQKLISQATIETQEQERGEIGKELHDNVNQVLTTTKLYLDLSLSNPELKDDLIQKSSRNIIYVINEIRQLSRSLMNPSLGDLGLIDSIHDLIENINLTRKLQVHLNVKSSLEKTLSDNQKLMIFRIIQEALNNAMKHAKAKNVEILLSEEKSGIQLLIQDDGVGFQPLSVKRGAGLNNIENRVYLAGGTLIINSEPSKGCAIKIQFPTTHASHYS